MTAIPLTQRKIAIVDDCDADLAWFKWHAQRHRRTFYVRRKLPRTNGRQHVEQLHRAVWARAHPGESMPAHLDHVDGDGLNCRRGNLRAATAKENGRNRGPQCNNTSGFKGVYFYKKNRRWRAYIRANGTQRHLGGFATREEAAHAYDQAARKLHGEFACVNFPFSGERQVRLDARSP